MFVEFKKKNKIKNLKLRIKLCSEYIFFNILIKNEMKNILAVKSNINIIAFNKYLQCRILSVDSFENFT